MSTIRILSIGAAVQDVFLQGKIFKAHKDEDGDQVQEFELGTKNEIENITITTGGGATNAAVTFARQGLHSAYLGNLGKDVAAKSVLDDLHKEGVDTSLVKTSKKDGTGYSAILLAPNGERTILTYRGASNSYNLREEDFHDSRPDWLYISSLSGDIDALEVIFDYAAAHNIKVAINPGGGELKHATQFKKWLNHITILSLNKEEMQKLFGNYEVKDLLRAATSHVDTALLTDGPRGSYVSDGAHIFTAGMYEDVKVVDRAGAGDAFSSGFVCKIASGHSIEEALTFASANSTSVVSKIGAKTGILDHHAQIHRMPIKVTNLR